MRQRTDRSFVAGATFALAVFALASVPLAARAAEQDQTDRQTRVMAIGASGSLELKNISGDISVTAGSGNDARIEVTRRSRGKTADDARRGLEQVTVDIDQQGERATVVAHYPDGRDSRRNDYSVDVTLLVTAPAGTRVTASTVSGNVRIENVTGSLSASSVSGNISLVGVGTVADGKTVSGSVSAANIASNDSLSLTSVSGDIRVDRVSARRLDGSTTSGNVVATGITSERATLRSLSGNVTYSGTLARSGRYELQSHSGDVSFNPSGNVGYELQASTFSGRISAPGSDLTVKSISPGPSALRTTVGDGGATVALTTFSGDVKSAK